MKVKKEYFEKLKNLEKVGIESELIKEYNNGEISLISFKDTNRKNSTKEFAMVLHLESESVVFTCAQDVSQQI